MCYNCGCFNPDDDMGSTDNITNETFRYLATKGKKSEDEVKLDVYNALKNKTVDANKDLKETFDKAAQARDQSVEEAVKQTYQMLKGELKK